MTASTFFMEVFYSGKVQGVGFRWQTLECAKEYDVCGFVQNLPDGRVLLQVEGAQKEVSAFKTAIEQRLSCFIKEVAAQSRERMPEFSGFEIKR